MNFKRVSLANIHLCKTNRNTNKMEHSYLGDINFIQWKRCNAHSLRCISYIWYTHRSWVSILISYLQHNGLYSLVLKSERHDSGSNKIQRLWALLQLYASLLLPIAQDNLGCPKHVELANQYLAGQGLLADLGILDWAAQHTEVSISSRQIYYCAKHIETRRRLENRSYNWKYKKNISQS